jgi:hypothetical protein
MSPSHNFFDIITGWSDISSRLSGADQWRLKTFLFRNHLIIKFVTLFRKISLVVPVRPMMINSTLLAHPCDPLSYISKPESDPMKRKKKIFCMVLVYTHA